MSDVCIPPTPPLLPYSIIADYSAVCGTAGSLATAGLKPRAITASSKATAYSIGQIRENTSYLEVHLLYEVSCSKNKRRGEMSPTLTDGAGASYIPGTYASSHSSALTTLWLVGFRAEAGAAQHAGQNGLHAMKLPRMLLTSLSRRRQVHRRVFGHQDECFCCG